jgi:hypothetical protein
MSKTTMKRDETLKQIKHRLDAISGLRDLSEMHEEQPESISPLWCARELLHDAKALLEEEIAMVENELEYARRVAGQLPTQIASIPAPV